MQQQQQPKSMGKTPCCSKIGLNRGPWTPEEDLLLTKYIQAFGEGRWRTLPKKAGLQRCGKSCRLRWMNYLRPDVKRGYISPEEEDLILRLHRLLGNKWSLIAGRIPGRTDNEIKNYWNTHLSKQLISQGIDPRTHKPLSNTRENPSEVSNTPNSISNESTQQGSKPEQSALKRSSDSVDIMSHQSSEDRARKKLKSEMHAAMEFFKNYPVPHVVAATAPNYGEPSDIIEWKSHAKHDLHMIQDRFSLPLMDTAGREAENVMQVSSNILNNICLNIPTLEAPEPALLSHGYHPIFMSNPLTTFDMQSTSTDCNLNPMSQSAPSISKTELYEGNMLSNANNYDIPRRYNVPKEEVFVVPSDLNQAVNNNSSIFDQIPGGSHDSYAPYLDSIVHEELLHNFSSASSSTSQAMQLRIEKDQNPSSNCDLWSLYQYHPYT